MAMYKVQGGRWGEGWKPGDIIALDDNAARVRLIVGDIVPFIEEKEVAVEPKAEAEVAAESVVKKFCEYCDSKGVRHLKTCARPQ